MTRIGVLVYLSGDDTTFNWVDETLWNEILLWHARLCLDEINEDEFKEAVSYMCLEGCEHVLKTTHTQTWVLETPDITAEIIGLLTLP